MRTKIKVNANTNQVSEIKKYIFKNGFKTKG